MAVRERLYTAQELWEFSHRPGESARYELTEGQLALMSPAGGEHGDLASELDMRIRMFAKQHRLGHVSAAETGFILHRSSDDKRDTVRAPDVGFIVLARWPGKLPKGYIPTAPDLAVEVVSPGDSRRDIREKLRDYLRYGVRMVWMIRPATRTVTLHRPTGKRTLTIDDQIDGGDLLPGLKIPIRDIFHDE
jgi:Uma2 family endonuclease